MARIDRNGIDVTYLWYQKRNIAATCKMNDNTYYQRLKRISFRLINVSTGENLSWFFFFFFCNEADHQVLTPTPTLQSWERDLDGRGERERGREEILGKDNTRGDSRTQPRVHAGARPHTNTRSPIYGLIRWRTLQKSAIKKPSYIQSVSCHPTDPLLTRLCSSLLLHPTRPRPHHNPTSQ